MRVQKRPSVNGAAMRETYVRPLNLRDAPSVGGALSRKATDSVLDGKMVKWTLIRAEVNRQTRNALFFERCVEIGERFLWAGIATKLLLDLWRGRNRSGERLNRFEGDRVRSKNVFCTFKNNYTRLKRKYRMTF